MTRARVRLVAVTVAALSLLFGASQLAASTTDVASPSSVVPAEQTVQQQPNILVISLDDAIRKDAQFMPRVQRLLYDQGLHFPRAYSTTPLCCPARASMLTGQYTHNHGVISNLGEDGGFQAFDDRRTIATMLDQQGYSTALVGKYLNGYSDSRYVPPGWDRWKAPFAGVFNYTASDVSIDGKRRYVRSNMTRWYGKQGRKFVQAQTGEQPWLLYVSFIAPHNGTPHEADDPPSDITSPWVPPRDRNTYKGPRRTGGPSFNEDRMCDKRRVMCNLQRLKPRRLRALGETIAQRREALQSVDRQVKQLVQTLRRSGQLNETYIFFVSDNGFHTAQHRLTRGYIPLRQGGSRHFNGKSSAYEPSIGVPFVLRGPGVPKGRSSSELAGLIDLAPTIAGLASVGDQAQLDGIDLLAQLETDQPSTRPLVLESFQATARVEDGENFRGIVTRDGWKLVRYGSGEYEMYNLDRDPYELRSLDGDRRHRDKQERLTELLRQYRDCAGQECRS